MCTGGHGCVKFLNREPTHLVDSCTQVPKGSFIKIYKLIKKEN